MHKLAVSVSNVSDHGAVRFKIMLAKQPFQRKQIKYRRLKRIDMSRFPEDIQSSHLSWNNTASLEELVERYDATLIVVLDNHAPVKKRIITLRPSNPWITDEIQRLKKERRRLERRWRKTKLTVDREIYIQQCKTVHLAIRDAKSKYLSEMIVGLEGNQKELFKSLDTLLKGKVERKYPSSNSTEGLADYFATKIANM